MTKVLTTWYYLTKAFTYISGNDSLFESLKSHTKELCTLCLYAVYFFQTCSSIFKLFCSLISFICNLYIYKVCVAFVYKTPPAHVGLWTHYSPCHKLFRNLHLKYWLSHHFLQTCYYSMNLISQAFTEHSFLLQMHLVWSRSDFWFWFYEWSKWVGGKKMGLDGVTDPGPYICNA